MEYLLENLHAIDDVEALLSGETKNHLDAASLESYRNGLEALKSLATDIVQTVQIKIEDGWCNVDVCRLYAH